MYQELFFVSFVVFLFFLDLFFIQLFSQQCLYFLYIFSLTTLTKKNSWLLTVFIFSFLAAESIIVHTTLGIDFFVALMSYIIGFYALNNTEFKKSLLNILLLFFLTLTSLKVILSGNINWICHHCTSLKFTGNFIILYFSLKWLSAVKRGNRF